MNFYEKYIKEEMPGALEIQSDRINWRKKFTEDYPIEKIMSLTISEYIYSNRNKSSFCNKIYKNPLASLGNCWTSMFGIYLRNGENVPTLSPTFKNYNSYDKAFENIKSLIVKLLKAAEINDINSLNSNKLNSAFKIMLLTIYFPDKFMPAPTSTAINAYCKSVGVNISNSDSEIDKNIKIVKWKNSIPAISDWDTWHLMYFCDQLWRKHYTLTDNDFTQQVIIPDVRPIEENQSDELQYNIEVENFLLKNETYQDYVPSPKEPVNPIMTSTGEIYPRDAKMADIALRRANHKCEFDNEHITFARQTNGMPYTEAHHLIPISQQKYFDCSLDVPANIVSLCPTCHKCIHLGRDNVQLIHELYEMRKDELKKAGIFIDEKTLWKMYK